MTQPAMDATTWVGPFPFRDVPGSGLDDLLRVCDREAIEFAIASPFAALFDQDNLSAFARFARLAQSTAARDRFEFWPVVNPGLPGQVQRLRRLRDEFGFRGFRLLPMFHGYSLCDPAIEAVAAFAAEAGLVAQVFHAVSDERWHWMHHVPPLPIPQIEYLAARFPGMRTLVCGLARPQLIEPLLRHADGVTADLSLVRGPEFAVETLLDRIPAEKLIFGSQWPVQTLESTLWQIRHARIGDEDKACLLGRNFAQLLA